MSQGMLFVPAVATEEMLSATKGPGMSPGSWNGWAKKRHAKLYRQMIAVAPDPWQPIETAPKDRVIQLWVPGFGTWVDGPWRGAWSYVAGQWTLHCPFTGADGLAITVSEIPHPTHWMALLDEPGAALVGASDPRLP